MWEKVTGEQCIVSWSEIPIAREAAYCVSLEARSLISKGGHDIMQRVVLLFLVYNYRLGTISAIMGRATHMK